MNFNAEFPSLLRFFYSKVKIGKAGFLNPRKSPAQYGRSYSIPRILTLVFLNFATWALTLVPVFGTLVTNLWPQNFAKSSHYFCPI